MASPLGLGRIISATEYQLEQFLINYVDLIILYINIDGNVLHTSF